MTHLNVTKSISELRSKTRERFDILDVERCNKKLYVLYQGGATSHYPVYLRLCQVVAYEGMGTL